MEGPRVAILILLLLFILFSPEPQNLNRNPRFQFPTQNRTAELQHNLDILRESKYGDLDASKGRFLNLTGFREDDGYQWGLLSVAKDISRSRFLDIIEDGKNRSNNDYFEYELVGGKRLPLYRNVTGGVRGKLKRVDVVHHESHINLTEVVPGHDYYSTKFLRNITETTAEIEIGLRETNSYKGNLRSIRADIAIETSSSPSLGWQIPMTGIQFTDSGHIFLTTSSEKFLGKVALQHLALTRDGYNAAKAIGNETLTRIVEEYDDNFRRTRFDASNTMLPAPECEYIVWLQQHPRLYTGAISNQTSIWLEQVEKELLYPDGTPIGLPPLIEFSAVVFSPDCGVIMQSIGPMMGPKAEVYSALLKRLLVAFIIILGLQVYLLKRQMQEAATPSTKSRIAYQSFAIMAMGDGQMTAGLLSVVVAEDSIWLLSSAAIFLCVINVNVFETKFICDIWIVQVGDPAQRERERQANVQPTPGNPQPALANPQPAAPAYDGLQLPITTARPTDTGATPIVIPLNQNLDAAQTVDQQVNNPEIPQSSTAAFSAIYSRFYFFLAVLTFISLWATTWPRGWRTAYANTLASIYLSFWVPQIYRNVIRNCRKALSWEYVVGISVLRITPIVYWYFEPRNVLHIDTHPTTAYIFIGWVWLQVMALVMQQFLGPRLLVKDSWCPPAYDYHPLLRDDGDEESSKMLPIGFVASASEGKEKDGKDGKDGKQKIFDCAICMNEIEVPVVFKGDTSSSWLEQWKYMVTPCRHIFHTECLEGWMNLRLVCPVCREGLPPI